MDIDDHGFAIINYRNGIRANFTLNMFANEFYEELVITGAKKGICSIRKSKRDKKRQTKASIMVEVEGHQHYEGSKIGYRERHHGATFFEHEALISQLARRGRCRNSQTRSIGYVSGERCTEIHFKNNVQRLPSMLSER